MRLAHLEEVSEKDRANLNILTQLKEDKKQVQE